MSLAGWGQRSGLWVWDYCFPVWGAAQGRVPAHLCPCSCPLQPTGQARAAGAQDCPLATQSTTRGQLEPGAQPHPSCVPTVSPASATVGTCSISVLFKESPRVKGLKRELAGESSFPKPWSPRGVFWRGGLSGLLGELGDHAGWLGCCPHSTEHGVEARKELPQAPPALVLSSSAVFHRDLGGHAPESGSGPPGSWGHWAGCGCQGGQRSVGLDAWGPGGA